MDAGATGMAESYLRARVWCENNVTEGGWCCDGTGRFWFKNLDDSVLFSLTWT